MIYPYTKSFKCFTANRGAYSDIRIEINLTQFCHWTAGNGE